MAYNFSRRDFMKCAGVTVLAVAAGGLLTGCGGGGTDGTTINGLNRTADIHGVKFTVTNLYQEDAKLSIGGVSGGYDNAEYVFPQIKIENASGTPVSFVRTNFVPKVDGKELEAEAGSAGSYLKALAKGYIPLDVNGLAIQNNDVRNGVLCYTFPKTWKKLELTVYENANRSGAKVTFVLNNPNPKK